MGKKTLVVLLLAVIIGGAFAQELPRMINYQGKLTDPDGVAVDASVDITFRIYDVETGGAALWTEAHTGGSAIVVTNGLFDVQLGGITDLDLPFDDEYWIELEIGTEVLTPREKMATVPYAFRAIYADTAEYVSGGGGGSNWILSGSNLYPLSTATNVGVGTTTPGNNKIQALQSSEDYNAIYGQNSDWGVHGYLGYGGSLAGHPTGWGGAAVYGYSPGGWVDAIYGYAPSGGSGVIGRADHASYYGVWGYHGGGGYAGYFDGNVRVTGGLYDSSGDVGGAGQVLSSTGSGTNWIAAGGGSGWSLTGNSGTTPGTNFVGTTDNVPLSFRVDNLPSGRIASDNTFFGYKAGNSVTTGTNNVLIGEGAGYNLTSAEENTALGHNALYGYMASNVGNANVAIGWDAMFYSTDKNNNVAVGKGALSLPASSPIENTVAIGYWADKISEANPTNSVALGAYTDIGAENSNAIGYRAYAPNSNTLVLGSIDGINGASNTIQTGIGTYDIRARLNIEGGFAIGNGNAISSTHGIKRSIQIATDLYYGGSYDNHSGYLIYSIMPGDWGTGELRFACATNWGVYNTTTPALRITQSGIYANGTYYSSDRRIKSDFRKMPYGLEQIMALEPLYYSKHIAQDMADGKPVLGESSEEIGFIAQDLFNIIPEVVSQPDDDSAELWGIDYAKMVPVLVQAIQEQQSKIEELENKLESYKELEKRIELLENQ